MKINKIKVTSTPWDTKKTLHSVDWIETEDTVSVKRHEIFDDLESAKIFAIELKKNKYLLENS